MQHRRTSKKLYQDIFFANPDLEIFPHSSMSYVISKSASIPVLNSDCICVILSFFMDAYVEWSKSLPFMNSHKRRKKQTQLCNTLFALCSRKDSIEYHHMMNMRMHLHFYACRTLRKINVSYIHENLVDMMFESLHGITCYTRFAYKDSTRYSILFDNRSVACLKHIIIRFPNGEIQLWNVNDLKYLYESLETLSNHITVCPVWVANVKK